MKRRNALGVLVLATLWVFGCSLGADISALTSAQQPTVPLPAVPTQPAATGVIIVDNRAPGFRIESGDWGTCQRGECGGTCFGEDFLYADPDCADCRARFELIAPNTGNYDVYTWWPHGDDRATDTPFAIQFSGGTHTLRVNQRNSGDAWFWLRTITAQAGERIVVTVAASASGYANADAVALAPAGTSPAAIVAPPAQPSQPTIAPPTRAAATQPTVPPAVGKPGAFRKIIFLHHSTGEALIAEEGVRERLTALGYEFYDHGYNDDGLRLANGQPANMNFNIPDDNTDPDGFNAIFAQPLTSPPRNAFSHLMQYDVIAFKSCFPTSDIQSNEQLEEYKTYYRNIRTVMDKYPNKIFIVVTPPPLVPSATNATIAARARAFANWLKSAEYLNGHPNIFTFDFFNLLAESNPSARDYNMLRAAYRADPNDSHPNERANREIGPQFADFIARAIQTYTGK